MTEDVGDEKLDAVWRAVDFGKFSIEQCNLLAALQVERVKLSLLVGESHTEETELHIQKGNKDNGSTYSAYLVSGCE